MNDNLKNKHLFARMGFATSGFFHAFLNEKSVRFHLIAALLVFLFLLFVRPPLIWWALVIIVVAMVISAELFNTAIEVLCDFVQPDHSEKIKIIKDVAAGAVLVASIGAVLVALVFLLEFFIFTD